jgi:glutamine cyclotransferase
MVTFVALVLVGGAWALVLTGATAIGVVQSEALTLRSLRVDVLRDLPHDTTAYTQGLLWRDGWLYESTGQYGDSRLRRIDAKTGRVDQQIYTSPAFFGEGLAAIDDQLVMLTWKAERAFIYDADSFEEIKMFRYSGEGWGLCYDNDRRRLVMSNGSDMLMFRDPMTFESHGSIRVTLRGRPLMQLNELACVGDVVYANVYQEDYLVVIDSESGRVTHQIDAAGLLTNDEARGVDVLNGIAYDPVAESFYITGKDWPKIFEVRFVE